MDHEDEGGLAGGGFEILRLEHAGDADATLAEFGGDLGEHAGHVIDGETQIMMRNGVIDGLRFAVEAMRDEAAVPCPMHKHGGGFAEITDDAAARRVLAGPATVEERLAHDIAIHKHGIEATAYAGHHMTQWHQRGLGADLNKAVFIRPDDGEELDRVA